MVRITRRSFAAATAALAVTACAPRRRAAPPRAMIVVDQQAAMTDVPVRIELRLRVCRCQSSGADFRQLRRRLADGADLVRRTIARRHTTPCRRLRHAALVRRRRGGGGGRDTRPDDAGAARGRAWRHPPRHSYGRHRRHVVPALRRRPASDSDRGERRQRWRRGADGRHLRVARVCRACARTLPGGRASARPRQHPSRVLRKRHPVDERTTLVA
jgi:hypothetical protein